MGKQGKTYKHRGKQEESRKNIEKPGKSGKKKHGKNMEKQGKRRKTQENRGNQGET